MKTYGGLLDGGEHTGGLHDVVDASIAPLDVGWVPPARSHTHTKQDIVTEHS